MNKYSFVIENHFYNIGFESAHLLAVVAPQQTVT